MEKKGGKKGGECLLVGVAITKFPDLLETRKKKARRALLPETKLRERGGGKGKGGSRIPSET